jgi:hypothetical protein
VHPAACLCIRAGPGGPLSVPQVPGATGQGLRRRRFPWGQLARAAPTTRASQPPRTSPPHPLQPDDVASRSAGLPAAAAGAAPGAAAAAAAAGRCSEEEPWGGPTQPVGHGVDGGAAAGLQAAGPAARTAARTAPAAQPHNPFLRPSSGKAPGTAAAAGAAAAADEQVLQDVLAAASALPSTPAARIGSKWVHRPPPPPRPLGLHPALPGRRRTLLPLLHCCCSPAAAPPLPLLLHPESAALAAAADPLVHLLVRRGKGGKSGERLAASALRTGSGPWPASGGPFSSSTKKRGQKRRALLDLLDQVGRAAASAGGWRAAAGVAAGIAAG